MSRNSAQQTRATDKQPSKPVMSFEAEISGDSVSTKARAEREQIRPKQKIQEFNTFSRAFSDEMPISSIDKVKIASFVRTAMRDVRDGAYQTARSSLSSGERFTLATFEYVKKWSRRGFTHIFLFLVLMMYNSLGAIVMMAIENSNSNKTPHIDIQSLRHKATLRVVGLVGQESEIGSDGNRTELLYEQVAGHLKKLLEEYGHQLELRRWYPDPDNNPWGFWGALFFCFTAHSTIGYGHLSPSTDSGRAVTMVYALLGIPIFLAVLADYGKLLTRILKLCMAHVYRMYRHCTTCTRVRPAGSETGSRAPRAPEESAVVVVDDEFNLPISLALSILAFYLLIGSALFALTEDWSYFESFYFVFISMTTIGFGDYVPSSAGVMMATVLYMIFGLALTSMCINVIQEKLANQLQQASLKLGSRLGVAAGVEGSSRPPPVVEVAAVHGKAG